MYVFFIQRLSPPKYVLLFIWHVMFIMKSFFLFLFFFFFLLFFYFRHISISVTFLESKLSYESLCSFLAILPKSFNLF